MTTRTADEHEAEYRRRLQRALGDAFELRERIGYGGFAAVYAARDVQLKRDVAVKVLREELVHSPAIRERFRREAEAVARLRHPHIVPIYAVGEGEGLAYFIMPLVAGEGLPARLEREGRLAVAEVRRILLEAAGALAAAHRAGIVHRDIKPDNILLDGDEARVLLTDFGIAKALGPEIEELTQTGAVVGTPQYMSPEQASGERTIDHRSDLYSLGVVAYQMLTGEVPFTGATVAALLLKQITEGAPPVTRKRPDCPSDLAAVVTRCLAKAPENRWATADDLVRALQSGVATPGGMAPTADDLGRGITVPDPVRRFRRLVAACVAAVVLLVVVDAMTHRVLLAPLGAIVGAFIIAAQYGKLWTAGYGWRDLIPWKKAPVSAGVDSGPTTPASPVPFDSAELGPHRAAIQQARSDRAAMLAIVQRLPKAERALLADVMPTVDHLLARATEVARQLHALKRQIEPGPEEIEQRLAATRAEPPSPGREQRAAVLERRGQTIHSLMDRRDRVGTELSAILATVAKLRFELERAASAGLAEALEGIRVATEEGRPGTRPGSRGKGR